MGVDQEGSPYEGRVQSEHRPHQNAWVVDIPVVLLDVLRKIGHFSCRALIFYGYFPCVLNVSMNAYT